MSVMARFLWTARDVIHTYHLRKGRAINSQYYAILMNQLKEVLKKKPTVFGQEECALPQQKSKGAQTPSLYELVTNLSLIRHNAWI